MIIIKKSIILVLVLSTLIVWVLLPKRLPPSQPKLQDHFEHPTRMITLRLPFDESVKGMVVSLCSPPLEEGDLFDMCSVIGD